MHYGPIIKEIRCAKKRTQKEVYSGIVSRSFCAKFEHGDYSIEISKFNQILERLTLSFEEFLFFAKPTSSLRLNELLAMYYKLNLHTVENLLTVYEQDRLSDLSHERFLAATAYALAYSLKPTLDKTPLAFFKEYFIKSDFFTLVDLELLITTLFLFIEENDSIIESLFIKMNDSLLRLWLIFPAKTKELIGSLYVNRVQFLLAQKKIDSACYLHLSFQKWFSEEQLSLTTRLYFDFFSTSLSHQTEKFNQVSTILKNYDHQMYRIMIKIKESSIDSFH